MTERIEIILKEFDRLHTKHGILRPADIVKAATPKSSPLHDMFQWDDTQAATQYRLWQAREMIRVSVRLLPQNGTKTRVYVSLGSDRIEDGGGYRCMVSVMSDADQRAELLADVLGELKAIRIKYAELQELAAVFAAIDKAG